MRLLVDIGHPAHVHLFKNLALYFQNKGDEILFTCRQKEYEEELLQLYGFNYISFGVKYNKIWGKIWGLVKFDFMMFKVSMRFKPDIMLSHGSIYAAHAAGILRKTHISLEDTGNWEQMRLYLPFTKVVLTGDSFKFDLGHKQVRFNSYNELAYLHPKWFKLDNEVLRAASLLMRGFCIIRFIGWNASHDHGEKGLSLEQKIALVKYMSQRMEVMISSECDLNSTYLDSFTRVPFDKVHSYLALALCYVGEGGTMANEASLLGTPSILVNPLAKGVGIHEELSKVYHVQKICSSFTQLMNYLKQIDDFKHYKTEIGKNYIQLMKNKIDLTSFMIDIVGKYRR